MKLYTIAIICLMMLFGSHSTFGNKLPPGLAATQIVGNENSPAQNLKQVDSVRANSFVSGDQVLLEYVKVLKEDAEKHRLYVQEYYDHFFYLVAALITVAGGILTFFGIKSLNAIKAKFEALFNRESKTRLEKMWNEKSKALDKKIEEFIIEVKNKFIELDIELDKKRNRDDAQSNEINDLNVAVVGLKTKDLLRVKKSYTLLEYEVSDGSEVIYLTRQEVVCISDEPVNEIVEKIKVDEPGVIALLEWNKEQNINPQIRMEKNGCEIKLLFEPPLLRKDPPFAKMIKSRFSNAFLNDHETWAISQSYVSDEEMLELRLPRDRKCKKVWVEKITFGGSETIDCKISPLPDNNHDRYLLDLPSGEVVSRYIIHWNFASTE